MVLVHQALINAQTDLSILIDYCYNYTVNSKSLIWIFLAIGSTIGGAIPILWGDSFFSIWSVILTAVGGILGIYIGYKLSS
jgi:hypothetical protein